MKALSYRADGSMVRSPKSSEFYPLCPPHDTHHSSGIPHDGFFFTPIHTENKLYSNGKRRKSLEQTYLSLQQLKHIITLLLRFVTSLIFHGYFCPHGSKIK